MEAREDRLSPTYDGLAEKFTTNPNILPIDWTSSMKEIPHKFLGIRKHLEITASTMTVEQAEQFAETTNDTLGSATTGTLPNFDDSCT